MPDDLYICPACNKCFHKETDEIYNIGNSLIYINQVKLCPTDQQKFEGGLNARQTFD